MVGLDLLNIEYDKIDVNTKEGEEFFVKIYKITKSEDIPIIIVGKQILVPNISFKTIDNAIEIIKKLI
jgi:glutaredoxin